MKNLQVLYTVGLIRPNDTTMRHQNRWREARERGSGSDDPGSMGSNPTAADRQKSRFQAMFESLMAMWITQVRERMRGTA